MIKKIVSSLILASSLYASECSPYFDPDKFYEAPEYLGEVIDSSLNNLKLFSNKESYEKLNYKLHDGKYINESIKLKEYLYPKKSGLYSFKLKGNKVDEIEIATVNLYKSGDMEIAEEINNDFEGFWSDWIEDGYEMQLVPEQVLLQYDDKYFSFSVFIYGVKGDTTRLKGTTIKYWLKDYSSQVNEFIQCSKKKK